MHRERMWSWNSTKEVGKSHQDSPFLLILVSPTVVLKGGEFGSTVCPTATTKDCHVASRTDKAGKRDL